MRPGTPWESSNVPWNGIVQRSTLILPYLCSHLHPPMAQPTTATAVTIATTTEDIAATVAALVPHPSASILELVKARLPPVISEHEAAKIPPENHLVNLAISGTLSDVLEGPIPHRTWLTKLREKRNKAQKAGCIVTSIQHPTRADLTLPLWALPVWDSIAFARPHALGRGNQVAQA